MRMEHIWLLLAAEVVNCLWDISDGDNRSFIVEHIGLLLKDELNGLCRFYDELQALNTHKSSPVTFNVADLALGFWNTDLAEAEVCHESSYAAKQGSLQGHVICALGCSQAKTMMSLWKGGRSCCMAWIKLKFSKWHTWLYPVVWLWLQMGWRCLSTLN